jgi:DeoR/GlpR family transcriptional regulator of sugar metabolism
MILTDIKRYLRERGQVALNDLAVRFDTEREAMRSMLEPWIQKGRLTRSRPGACSGGCAGCRCDAGLEIYIWRP